MTSVDQIAVPSSRAVQRGLDPLVKWLFAGVAFSALGCGLTMPFLYVYLAQVRGISTPSVGLLLAWMGLLGFLASPVSGSLIDRFGPRPVMLVGLVAEAAGLASLAFVQPRFRRSSWPPSSRSAPSGSTRRRRPC